MFQLQTARMLLIWVALFGFLSALQGSEADANSSSPVIFYSNEDSIRYIGVNDLSVRGTLISGLTKARALALYVERGWIVWSEKDGTEISRLHLPGGTKEVILHTLEVRDIAIEWETGLIYWTDHGKETIEVARIDGSYRKTLISGQYVANPMAIAVDPLRGFLFWSETGWDMPSIVRATLAGTEITVIVDEFPGFIPHLLINGLVIDYSSKLLYWVDAQTVVIEHVNFYGSDRVMVQAFSIYPYPYRATLYKGVFYYSDLKSRSIERFNLTTAEHLHNMGWLTIQRVYGIALNDSSREPPGKTDCKTNSECSHLCLLTPSGYQCACPDGYELLPDNKTCNATVQPTRPPVPEIEIRLMIGNAESVLKGRVEVRRKDNNASEWGTVCDDHFDMRDAKVVCRMLNHSGAVSYGSAYFRYGYGTGSDDSQILLDNLKCRGDEASLMECKHKGWGNSDCGHFEDVAVVCKNDSIPTVPPNVTSPTIGPPANFTIRLRGGDSEHAGRVEIVYNGTVGTICDNDFDIDDANVICKMLGFKGAWSTMCCGRYGYGYGSIWLDNLQCTGNETTLSACPHLGWGNHDDVCSHYNDAGVFCIPKPVVPPDSIIRLVDGTSENQGRVEIYHKGKWGTICDDGWDLKDATVICRMLNYTGALAAPLFGSYDSGSGKIWLDETNCVGNESSIEDCSHGGWGKHDCTHFEDAGVICQANDSALPVYDARKMLLFSEYSRSILFQAYLEGDVYQAAPLPFDNIRGLTAVGFDPIERQVYYGQSRPGLILRSPLNGSAPETIINGVYFINRLAIDYVFRIIYFTDTSRDRIDVATLEGKYRKRLISTPAPEDIALDLENGTIYWTSNGYPPRIERADMDGENVIVIRNLTDDSYSSGITFDSSQKRLYWTDRNVGEVYYIDLVTNRHGTFISHELYDPIDLAILGNKLYVTDSGSGEWDGGIYSALLGGSGNVSKVIDLLKYTWAIASYDADSILQLEPRGCQLSDRKCSHLCLNSPDVPHCTCPNGMRLKNATTCVYRTLLLYTECFYSEIYKAPLGGDDLFSVANSLALENPSCPSAIASNPATGQIYWTDTNKYHIVRANLDGTGEEIILENVTQSKGGLVVNARAGNMYYTDSGKKTLEVAKLDGSCRKVLIQSQTHEFVGLAIDSMRGYMYYSAWGKPTMIERAQMDGSDRTTLIEWVEWPYQRPTALTIDMDENVLYWVGDLYPSLQFIDLRYPHSEIVHHIEFSNYLHYPFGLALDAHYFYWTDGLLGNVIRASRGPNPEVTRLIPYQLSPRGVNIYDPDDIQDNHPCVDSCSHLCLLKPGGYKCACSDDCATPCNESIHVTNTFGCTNDPSLYFIDTHHIKCIDLESSNQTYVSVKTVRSDIIQGGAIDIDHRERMIYWSDNALWTISRMSLVTGDTEVIIRHDLGEVLALAVDWESGLIYWTDFTFERIEVAKLDGSYRKTLFTTGFYSPRGIAVDPVHGYMFWTDFGFDYPRIERADLTGDNRQALVSFGLDWYYQFHPVNVVIEYQTRLMYWIDKYNNYIDYADIDGGNKTNLDYIGERFNPVDLALYGDMLYWADWHSFSIQYLNKTQQGSGLTYNFGHLTDDYMAGCVVSDESRQPVASPMNRPPCRINNGGCSHLCLLAPGGKYKCACPNGVELEADNKTCSNVTKPKPPPTPVPDLKVRLSGSNSSHEGRVEVYHQGEWGTVCDDHWGMQEATVVCKMLNFSGAIRVDSFGPGNSSSMIWMDNVKCRGDELSIAACRHRGWGNEDCTHTEDAGVVCRNDSIPPTEGPTLSPGPHPELQVRLRSGLKSNEGRVELFLNGTWGTICGNDWGIEDANVICRMMGFTRGAWGTHCCSWYSGLSAPDQIWLDRVGCVGDETSIAECRHGGWGSHNCDHSEDIGVVCKYTPPPTPDQKVRLADGIRDGEGRVEVFHNGHWGTVCDDNWGMEEAQVVCKQLGYNETLAAPRLATFGEGNGHIWLVNAQCKGNESSILDCENAGYDVHPYYCQHYEDASVICWNESRSLPTDDFLLLYEGKRGLCQYVSLPLGPSPVKLLPLRIDIGVFPYHIFYDPVDGRIYWTGAYGTIYRAFLNGESREVVISGVSFISCFWIDFVGRNMYFCDYYSSNVRVASLDGKLQANVVEIPYPQGIVVDSETKRMFYTSYETSSSSKIIYRADMDGKNQMVIANVSLIADTYYRMAMDYQRHYIFVADNSKIRYIKLNDNNEINTLFHEIPTPTNIQILNGTMYWATQGDGGFQGALFYTNITESAPTAKAVADSLGEPSGIYVHNSLSSQIPVDSPCKINNGGCSQLCVLNPNGRRCLCQAGMKVADDGISCTLGDVVLVTDIDHQDIFYSPLTGNILSPLPLSNVTAPVGIAFGPCDDHVYWTDSEHHLVARSTIDGKKQEIIRSNVTEPTGMDLDLVGGHVYWINRGDSTIEVSKLNGDYWKVLVSNVTSGPFDIGLDPTRGYMYWSAPGIIEGAEMDGSNRRTIALLGVNYYGDPIDAKGLTVDVPMNRLYFVSYEKYALLYIDLASGNNTVETLISHFWLFFGPYGIAISGEYVYWSEHILYGRVFRTNKTSADVVENVVQGLYNPRGIAVKEGNCTLNSTVHPCSTNTSGCTHLCLITPSGYKCDCPEVIDDGRNCTPSFVYWPPTTKPPTTTTKPPTTTPIPPTTTPIPPTTTPKPPSTTPVDHCELTTCQNGATCEVVDDGFKCHCEGYFGGADCSTSIVDEVTEVTFNMTKDKFNETEVAIVISNALNSECAESTTPPPECSIGESTESIAKRAVQSGPFYPKDIYFPSAPTKVNGGILVEYAVVRTSAAGKSVVVPSTFVTAVTKKRAAEIGKNVGGNVMAVRQKPVEKVTSSPQTGRSNGGLIAGVVVSVGLIVIVAAVTVWYYRVKKTGSANIPYVKEDDDQTKTRRTTAFENPGYDSTGAHQGGAQGDYDDLGPVTFSPFEETTESGGASNPIYAEIGMTRISSSQDINTDGTAADSAGKNEATGELHKKVPDHVEITVEKEVPAQEEARYVSLFSEKSKEAKNDQTTVEVEKEEEPRYQTMADVQSPPSDDRQEETDQTVVVLDDNNKPTA